MLKVIEQLLVLQDRDRKIRSLRQELKHAPLERRQFEERLAGAAGGLEAVKQRGRLVEVERKKLENEAQSKRDAIAKYQTAKFQTRKNEEFQAMTTAIEHLEAEIRKIEDQELELMDSTEKLKPQIADADRVAATTKDQVARQSTDLDAKIKAVEAQVLELEGGRARLAEGLDEDLLDSYERLFATKGEAVVPLEHDVCAGCHMKVTASTAARVKGRRDVMNCEHCNRILYPGE